MAEYIERTAELILAVNAGARVIENTKRYHGASYCVNVFAEKPKEIPYLKAAEVLRGFDEIPAADVAPVVHGEWIATHKEKIVSWQSCSKCGSIYPPNCKRHYNFCPHCGAKMGGERKGDDAV